MARPRIPASVLAQKGVPLTLAGGLEVTLCFSFKALMLIEQRYGSLENAAALMGTTKPAAAPDATPDGDTITVADSDGSVTMPAAMVVEQVGKPFETIAGLLACGLAHETTPAEDDGVPLDNPDVLADYLESDKVNVYSDAISAAIEKAFPSDPTPPVSGDTSLAETEHPQDSRGASGTGSPASGSDSATTSSGA